jgi:hypothetical protein
MTSVIASATTLILLTMLLTIPLTILRTALSGNDPDIAAAQQTPATMNQISIGAMSRAILGPSGGAGAEAVFVKTLVH